MSSGRYNKLEEDLDPYYGDIKQITPDRQEVIHKRDGRLFTHDWLTGENLKNHFGIVPTDSDYDYMVKHFGYLNPKNVKGKVKRWNDEEGIFDFDRALSGDTDFFYGKTKDKKTAKFNNVAFITDISSKTWNYTMTQVHNAIKWHNANPYSKFKLSLIGLDFDSTTKGAKTGHMKLFPLTHFDRKGNGSTDPMLLASLKSHGGESGFKDKIKGANDPSNKKYYLNDGVNWANNTDLWHLKKMLKAHNFDHALFSKSIMDYAHDIGKDELHPRSINTDTINNLGLDKEELKDIIHGLDNPITDFEEGWND